MKCARIKPDVELDYRHITRYEKVMSYLWFKVRLNLCNCVCVWIECISEKCVQFKVIEVKEFTTFIDIIILPKCQLSKNKTYLFYQYRYFCIEKKNKNNILYET